MRILFDFRTVQNRIGGAQEYTRSVFYALLARINSLRLNHIEIIAAVDTTKPSTSYDDMVPEKLTTAISAIADLGSSSLPDIIREFEINTVFIGAAQFWSEQYEIDRLTCKVVCVVHDICDSEYEFDKIDTYVHLFRPHGELKTALSCLRKHRRNHRMDKVLSLINTNPNVKLITVSEYSKNSICYHFPIDGNKIAVLFSPFRMGFSQYQIAHQELKELINSGKRYYLMLSVNRPMKNAGKAIMAFKRYAQNHSDAYLLTVGGTTPEFENHIVMPYLSESDLQVAYSHCHALIFPSYFEGFGYPPIEAMRFGKPVLASNVTSIPEVLGNAPIYFSPFYTSDIYASLVKLEGMNYDEISKKSLAQYQIVRKRQDEDLAALVDLLIS